MAVVDPSYKLGTFSIASCAPFAGAVYGDDKVVALAALADTGSGPLLGTESLFALLQHWDRNSRILSEIFEAGPSFEDLNTAELSSLRVHAPLVPGSLICAAANYRDHVLGFASDSIEEAVWAERMDAKAKGKPPLVFSKPVSAVIGPVAEIAIPYDVTMLDWEVELVAVIGKRARRVHRHHALDYVAGYTVGNDLSARDIMPRDDIQPGMIDFCGGKGGPGFNPLGPFIVPARFVPDPQTLHLHLTLNGEVMQDEGTDLMIDSVARLIEYASSRLTLQPGDMIMTGSPSGNAKFHGGRYLRPGDVIEARVEGIGAQHLRFVSESVHGERR